jgi:D-glycero-D-manno-heptose 1,7-bisphosphate phosphatase
MAGRLLTQTGRRALFLDRDGVINIDHGYVYLPEQTDWVPGIFELCATAKRHGYELVVITNQAGIARGYYGEAEFAAYSRWMMAQFATRGLDLLAIYHCPHHPSEGLGEWRQDCDCRKPKPGLILRAQREHGIDLAHSALIGDKVSDVQAGRAAGVGHCQLVGTAGHESAETISMTQAIAWLESLEGKD